MNAAGRKELALSDLGESDRDYDLEGLCELVSIVIRERLPTNALKKPSEASGCLAGVLHLTVNHPCHLITSISTLILTLASTSFRELRVDTLKQRHE